MPEIFNPDVPKEQPGNYIGWSRPISSFQGNQSQGTLLKGIGSDIDEGADVLNKSAKMYISDEENRGISALRDQQKERLTTVYNQSVDNPDSLLPDQAGAPPAHIANQVDHNLDTLHAARISGKYSDAYIDMQYDDFLKGMRAKYPGYREYIDESAARSLDRGLPANREIRQLTSDINANIQTAKQDRDKALDLQIAKIAAGGDPEGAAVWQYKHLLTEQEKNDFVSRKVGDQANIDRYKNARDATDDPGARAAAGKQEANLRLDTAVSNFVHTFTMGQGGATPEQLVAEIRDTNTSDEDRAKAKLTLQTYMQAFKAKQMRDFSQVDPKTNRSLDQDIGGRGGDLIDQHLDTLKNFTKWVDNGQGGAVAATVEHVKASSNPTSAPLMPNSAGTHAKNVDAVVRDNPNGDGFLVGLSTNRIGSNSTRAAANARHISAAAGTDYSGNPNNPLTINHVLDESKGKFSPDKVGNSEAMNYFNNVVSWYKDTLFQKDNPALQRNMGYMMYGPGNEDVMKHFDPETSDKKGQASVFNMWFSPSVDKEMFTNLGKQDTNLLSSYENLKKDSFGKYVLPGEIKNMDGMASVKDLKWSYDNIGHKLTPYYNGDTPPEGFSNVVAATARLNIGLASMDSMNKYTKEDTNVEMFQWLKDAKLGNGPASKAVRDAVTQSFSAEQQKKQDAADKLKKMLLDLEKGKGTDDDDN
jgi:hypothetical protein